MNIFTLDKVNDTSDRLNIDELYERKREKDLKQAQLYAKILNRIYTRIKTITRSTNDTFCWYSIPEMILGINHYNDGECIAYLISKLNTSGFKVKYIHPNLLFIVWDHWIPSYVRTELKNKVGINIDEYGNIIEPSIDEENKEEQLEELKPPTIYDIDSMAPPKKKEYKPIQSYKPTYGFN